jgi:xylulose-5-phosphate/fructose-6-phosphate phosphoketolase
MNTEQEILALDKLTRITNYLSAAQIFLRRNTLLEESLHKEDIKLNLLGHWGTCPGINLVYAHTNRLIVNHEERDFMLVVGPGHGFPAFQSGIFIEGSLSELDNRVPYTKEGLKEMVRKFSVPYGFPSHLNPEAPGVILEGGELGYSLSVSAGAVFDNPKLIIPCIIGDGEAETGSLAASWHVNKFILKYLIRHTNVLLIFKLRHDQVTTTVLTVGPWLL